VLSLISITVISQKESLVSLSMCEVLCNIPEFKIAIIGNDLKELKEAFKIHVPILECFCDSKHLAVIDLVVVFGFIINCNQYMMGCQ
jgi:hypothetical protein